MRDTTTPAERADDRGAILIWCALSMTVILGFGAIVIDVGRMYVEKRELQNGADAAALASANVCSSGSCASALTAAAALADSNAADGRSGVTLCGRGAPGLSPCATTPSGVSAGTSYVTARTSTIDPTNDDSSRLDLLLAPILDAARSDPTLRAEATATFGAPSTLTALNAVISQCEFLRVGGVVGSATVPSTVVQLQFREQASTCTRPNGFALPGGFGWLAGATRCYVRIQAPSWVNENPGKSKDNDCDLRPLVNKTVAIPIFSNTNNMGGANGKYYVDGFASFVITGYAFPGNRSPSGFRCAGGSSVSCLVGHFTSAKHSGCGTSGVNYSTAAIELVD